MFDAAVCTRVEILRQSSAACDALHKLKTLLIEARQSSWSSGGDDAEVVTNKGWSAQPVSSVGSKPDAAPETYLKMIVLLARMLHEYVTRSRIPKSEASDE